MAEPTQVVNVDYVNPGSMLALAVSFLNICTILVVLRIVGRWHQKLRVGIDDALIIAGWAATMAMCINMIVAVSEGYWGVPIPPITDADGNPIALDPAIFVSDKDVILPVQLTLTKLSILFCYLRLLCPVNSGYLYYGSIVMIVITALWGTSMFLVFLFQCGGNPSLFWDPNAAPDACLPATIEIFLTISDVVLDVIIFGLPMWRLFTVGWRLKSRLMAMAVFAIGGMSVIASLVRTAWYVPTLAGAENDTIAIDPNLFSSAILYWGMLEAGFGLMAACLPNLKYFVDRVINKAKAQYHEISAYLGTRRTKTPVSPAKSTSPVSWNESERVICFEEKGIRVVISVEDVV